MKLILRKSEKNQLSLDQINYLKNSDFKYSSNPVISSKKTVKQQTAYNRKLLYAFNFFST